VSSKRKATRSKGIARQQAPAEVFNPLPAGSRDLLPEASRLRRAVTRGLMECFERWGYEPITTPAIEYFEVFRRGLGEEERERCVRFIEARSGELVTLRSDITPQIARVVAQRMGGRLTTEDTVRLCYAADVVRLPDRRHDRAEFHQAGVELIGDASPAADAELISLSHEAMHRLGLAGMGIDLAHTAVVRDAFDRLAVSPREAQHCRAHLGRKDRGGLEQALTRAGVKGRARDAFVGLCQLHGSPEILDEARGTLKPLRIERALDQLQRVLDVLARTDPTAYARVSVDLGEVRGFDYYTGLRMRVWAPGVSQPIVRGGRYDNLLVRYGVDLPATGLAVDLDALEGALLHAGLEVEGSERGAARLVAVDPACDDVETRVAAMAESRAARARGLRSWVDVGLDRERATRAAEQAGADRLTIFTRKSGRGGGVTKERWRRGAKGWRKDTSSRKRSQ
jgi:ATP phosphoribosyltransferase regulatory subunit